MLSIDNNYVREIQLSYSNTLNDSVKIDDIDKAVTVFRKMWDKELIHIQEQFCVLFLNNALEVVGFRCLNTGTLTSCTVDLKILFSLACKSLSSGIIIAHNHPSGKTEPSKADIDLTKRVKEAGKLLDINLLDHIILTATEYTSMSNLFYI